MPSISRTGQLLMRAPDGMRRAYGISAQLPSLPHFQWWKAHRSPSPSTLPSPSSAPIWGQYPSSTRAKPSSPRYQTILVPNASMDRRSPMASSSELPKQNHPRGYFSSFEDCSLFCICAVSSIIYFSVQKRVSLQLTDQPQIQRPWQVRSWHPVQNRLNRPSRP